MNLEKYNAQALAYRDFLAVPSRKQLGTVLNAI